MGQGEANHMLRSLLRLASYAEQRPLLEKFDPNKHGLKAADHLSASKQVRVMSVSTRLMPTYMPRHTASYDPFNMTYKNITQNIMLKARASRPLISCKTLFNPTHSVSL
jgi:hypothetical protein